MEKVEFAVAIMAGMALAMWVFGYLYWALLSTFSIRISRRI